jgi:uncharacterized membrane protein
MELLGVLAIAYAAFLLVLPWLLWVMFKRLQRLHDRIAALERQQQRPAETMATSDEADIVLDTPVPSQPPTPGFEAVSLADEPAPAHSAPQSPQDAATQAAAAPHDTPTVGFDLFDRVKTWAVGGNTVARLGILVLFFGVAFLLKYTAERGLLPIELRLAAAALGGIGLVVLGWYLRHVRRSYALIVQGGGVGIVYLTVFAAVAAYRFVPVGLGYGLLLILVALASALAVFQDARSLAMLAATGGFLAPVLLARGGGSHVVLFAYYAILNGGILAIAWFKAWRELNLVGFLFTFVIGSLWGYQYYRPEYFASTEPFLILFVLFYLAVAVLFAHRQSPQLRGYVDGTLVFGVPLVAFGLQSALVRDMPYGIALSALGAGLLYALLATLLWRRRMATLRLLVEAFLALAVVFATVAIPLAVDGRWTSSAWALEGAALVWVGIRQRRRLARLSGLLIQLGAGIALLSALDVRVTGVLLLNSVYLSGMLVSLAGLLSGFLLWRSRQVSPQERSNADLAGLVLLWGVAWWFGIGLYDIWRQVPGDDWLTVGLGFVAVSCAVMGWLAWRYNWPHLHYVPMMLLPVMVLLALVWFVGHLRAHPLARWGFAAWFIALASQYGLLWRLEQGWPVTVVRVGHLGILWLTAFLVTWEVAWLLRQVVPDAVVWGDSVWGLMPVAMSWGLTVLETKLPWPVARFREAYFGPGRTVLIGWAALWVLAASVQPGEPQPLAYVPLLNPLELVQCVVLYAVTQWAQQASDPRMGRVGWSALGTLAFVVLNGMVARTMHFWGGVPFELGALLRASPFQTTLAITWTVLALSCMVAASRFQQRPVWFIGASLLGVVVIKLFLVDLARVETVARIVSFLVVGGLTVLIGYVSPLPPRAEQEVR